MSKGIFSELHLRTGVSGEFILDESLTYKWLDGQQIREITVPAEFPTDLASIPRIFRIAFPVNGKHRKAAAVHDFLYANHCKSRKWADLMFLRMMKDLGVSRFKRYPMYWGVRSGGWVAWKG